VRTVDGWIGAGMMILTVVAGLAVGAAPARAADDIETILKRGTELRRQNRDREALAEFQRAARLQDSPRVDAQMALAEQALGLWLEAHTHLSRALEHGNDPWISKNRTPLDRALATIRTHLSLLEVWGDPAGAEVRIDGKLVGKLPQVSLWLAAGDSPLQVTADGHAPLSKTLTIPEAARLREHVALRPMARPLATEAPTLSSSPRATSPPAIGAAPNLTASPSTEAVPAVLVAKPNDAVPRRADSSGDDAVSADVPAYRRWWFWTLIGAGALAAAGGTAWVVTHRTGNGDACTGTCSTWGTNP